MNSRRKDLINKKHSLFKRLCQVDGGRDHRECASPCSLRSSARQPSRRRKPTRDCPPARPPATDAAIGGHMVGSPPQIMRVTGVFPLHPSDRSGRCQSSCRLTRCNHAALSWGPSRLGLSRTLGIRSHEREFAVHRSCAFGKRASAQIFHGFSLPDRRIVHLPRLPERVASGQAGACRMTLWGQPRSSGPVV